MILRSIKWILAIQLLHLAVTNAQNARSYDTNDWIPITPTTKEKAAIVEQKKATGRVLNLDPPPQQKFFPEEDYRKKRPPPEQFLRETSHFPKHRLNVRNKPRYERPYKYEANYHPKPLPIPPPQAVRHPQLQYFTNQEVKPATHEQPPPPLTQPQYVQQPPPYQAPQFIYHSQPQYQQTYPQQQQVAIDPNYQQYVIPINNTLYHTINPTSINQDLLGAIQNIKLEAVPKTEVTTNPPAAETEKETVQLLYVPLENLKANQPVSQDSQNVYATADLPRAEKLTLDPQNIYATAELPRAEKQVGSFSSYSPPQRLAAIEKDFIQQALEAQKLQDEIRNGRPYLYQTTTTKPKKRKPHQPPLAVYMTGQQEAEVTDVLDVLKDAKSIAVQDNFRPDSPKVFIGPSTLDTPDGYSKFPLPYLNTIEGNRIERKIEQLPFFVAPLSYKTPNGYSKIPLPSPHVGSVVVSTKEDLHEKHPVNNRQLLYTPANQYQHIEKPQSGQFLTQNANVQDYNFHAVAQKQQLNKLPDNVQFIKPTTPEEVKQTYPVPARPQLTKLPPTLQEPSRPLTQEVLVEPNSGQSIYQQPELTQSSPYETPVRSTTPQIGIDEYGQYQIRNTLPPPQSTQQADEISQYPTPRGRYAQGAKSTTLPVQSFNLSDKVKSSFEITPSIEITPKSIFQGNLREQLHKEAVPTYQALSSPSPVQNYNINPLELAINKFELEQINSQLLEKQPRPELPRPQPTSLYYDDSVTGKSRFVSSTPRYEENFDTVTTSRSEKTKRRGKPHRQPTRTTPTVYDNTRYTVLEEYSGRQRTTTPRAIEVTPTVQYRERSTDRTEVEHIPSKVYQLNSQPVYTENRPPVNQHILNRDVLDQHVLKSYPLEDTRSRTQEQTTTRYQEIATEVPNVEPLSEQAPQKESYNHILSGYLSNLQDQSVRALLIPNLLVPTTTEQQKEITTTIRYEPSTSPTTERVIEIIKTTEEPQVETTTAFKRTRGRVRANSSLQSKYTSTSPPRRTVNRRRPTYRSTTEKVTTTTEYTTRRNSGSNKPRFRTRGRATQATTTTENAFKQPELQSGFRASPLQADVPESYMKFEHTIDEQKIITIKPEETSEESVNAMKDYHQLYSLPASGERAKSYESPQPQVVDIKITHPVETDIITKPNKNEEYVHFSSNIQAGDSPTKSRYSEDTTTQRSRVRGRTRGKPRYPTGTTSTTTKATTTATEQTKADEGEEFYGFFRQPDFTKPKSQEEIQTTEQPSQYYSSSYVSSPRSKVAYNQPTIAYDDQPELTAYNQPKTVYNEEFIANGHSTERSELSPPVHFIGEIRPKYYPTAQYEESKISIATVERDPITTTETQAVTKSRTRLTTSSEENSSYNEVTDTTNPTTARSRTRSRGKVHYQAPEKLRATTDEGDLDGENYPAFFTTKVATTSTPSFQITVDPLQEAAEEDDQASHSSIYSPKFLPKPSEGWIEASAVPFPNELPSDDKPVKVSDIVTDQPIALPIVASTESLPEEPITNVFNETSNEMSNLLTQINDMVQTVEEEATTTQAPVETKPTKKKGRRRGAWKLIKHRPVDQLEIAESQNYESVLNSFDVIKKVNYRNKYYEPERRQVFTQPPETDEIDTTNPPTEKEQEEVTTVTLPATTSEGTIFDTLYDMLGMKPDEEEPPATTTTTTTTEPPQEAVTTQTTISPTFPQEITEETPTTTTIERLNSTSLRTEEISFTTTAPDTDETFTITSRPDVTPLGVDPWQMRQVKTSTSTEVSHETEICYKGRCVKSLDRKTRS